MRPGCGLTVWACLLGCSSTPLLDRADAAGPAHVQGDAAADLGSSVPTPAPDGGPPQQSWSVVVDLASDTRLNKMWGSAADDIWLVGGGGFRDYSAGGSPEAPIYIGQPAAERIVHFDGTRAEEVAAPGTDPLIAIWGRSRDDVWATGGATLIHFDGKSWSLVATPFTPGFNAIWGASASDVWFAGGRTMRHMVAGVWSELELPGGREIEIPGSGGVRGLIEADNLLSLWGFSASDVWAGGGSGTLNHWDGVRWSKVPTGSLLYVYGLWGDAPDDVWGVGNGGYRLRWNGTGLEQSDEGYTSFNAVRGRARDDVWGVGSCCWQKDRVSAWVSHYDGAAWSAVRSAQWDDLQDVWVGPDGTVLAIAGSKQLIRLR